MRDKNRETLWVNKIERDTQNSYSYYEHYIDTLPKYLQERVALLKLLPDGAYLPYIGVKHSNDWITLNISRIKRNKRPRDIPTLNLNSLEHLVQVFRLFGGKFNLTRFECVPNKLYGCEVMYNTEFNPTTESLSSSQFYTNIDALVSMFSLYKCIGNNIVVRRGQCITDTPIARQLVRSINTYIGAFMMHDRHQIDEVTTTVNLGYNNGVQMNVKNMIGPYETYYEEYKRISPGVYLAK